MCLACSSATFEGGLQEQAVLMNKMGEHVDAVIIITNQIARMEDVSHMTRALLTAVINNHLSILF